MPALELPELSLLETRVLGVLVEKQRTVPDTYPLSLNALAAGCNQKTSRDPVMDASESEILHVIHRLKELKLVGEHSGGRVVRYMHQLGLALQVPTQALAILTVLMLRGPLTAGELRTNCERLHKFADISAVEGFLNEMAERSTGALVMELPRQPGARENRWAHLLSGPIAADVLVAHGSARANAAFDQQEIAELKGRVESLETQLQDLRAELTRLRNELGA